MELRQLRYFVTVAEYLHYGNAARALHMAQPPLSQQIQRLESDLGIELFKRTSRTVELSDAGASLLASARRILAEAASLEELARALKIGTAGQLRIAYVASVLNWGLAASLREFRQAFPDVQVTATQMPVVDQVEALNDGRIDVGFTVGRINYDSLRIQVLSVEPLVVLLPEDHRLASRDCVDLADLSKETFLSWRAPFGRHLDDFTTRACGASGFTPAIVYQGPQIHTVAHMVAAGFGVCLMPRCDRAMRTPGVAFKDLVAPAPWTVLSAVAPKWSVKQVALRLLDSLPAVDIDDVDD